MPWSSSLSIAALLAGPAWTDGLRETALIGVLAFLAAAERAGRQFPGPDGGGDHLGHAEHPVDDGLAGLDGEFTDLLIPFVLVDERDGLERVAELAAHPGVHVALPDVRHERAGDARDDPVEVVYVAAVAAAGVLGEKPGVLVPQGAQADRLDLRHAVRAGHGAVRVADDHAVLQVQGNLIVFPVMAAGVFAAGKCRLEAEFGAVADPAAPLSPQFPGAAHAVLPFAVDLVAFREDVLPLERERLSWFSVSQDAVADGAVA